MIKVPDPDELDDFDLREYKVPPLEKYVDKRGYIYIVYDEIFKDYIKIGRTSDCAKRLIGYNSDRPYPTCKMLYISDLFEDVNTVERKILSYMYSNTQPTTLSKEWFEIKHKEKLIKIIQKAELLEHNKQHDHPEDHY